MKRYIICLIALSSILSACATSMTNTEHGFSAADSVSGTRAPAQSAAMLGNYMDPQEKEFQSIAGTIDGFTIERQENTLFLTLPSDDFFDPDSTSLKREGYDEINHVADILSRYPNTHVKMAVHTDSPGSEQYNLRLTEDRAKALKNTLVNRGIKETRIAAGGLGESNPVASNTTDAGRQRNRRVTLEITPDESL